MLTKVVHVDNTRFTIKAVVDLVTLEKHFNHSLDKKLFGRLELLNVSFKFEREIPEEIPEVETFNLDYLEEEEEEEEVVEEPRNLPVVRRQYRTNDIDLSPLRHGGLIRTPQQRRGHLYMGYRWKNGNNINILKRW